MEAELTIKLDESVIEQAKKYAAAQGNSLSSLIESYLRSLGNPAETIDQKKFPITPIVRSMAKGTLLPNDLDYKKEYHEYLLQKHK